ncbi:MAG: hypothetical protein F6J97_01915 [Leptolyngbya sp. SIO4C1]|nr:hypothetical protein [Leptolyngbya sp. SIO4C1]
MPTTYLEFLSPHSSLLNLFKLNPPQRTTRLWLGLSLAFAVLYGYLFWRKAFEVPYSLQEDARQHVFWMQRWLDPALLPNDLIADYFQSLAPTGYKALYATAAAFGIHPFLFSKLLPPVLGIVATLYGFYACLRLLPVPMAAFISTLLLNQSMWMWRDLGSGTPRAFAIPLLLAFLYYFSKRSLWPCVAVVVLAGGFYPHLVLISVTMLWLRLLQWRSGPRLSRCRQDWWQAVSGLIAGILVLLPFVLLPSPYGPVVTAAQAQTMPEFLAGGRQPFFDSQGLDYWLGGKSGLFPVLNPVAIYAGFLLPLLLWRRRWLLLQAAKLAPLGQLAAASLLWFLAAHRVLFRLHAPNRYTHYSVRILLAMAAAIALVSWLEMAARSLQRGIPQLWQRLFSTLMAALLLGSLMLYPASLHRFLDVLYIKSDRGALYAFLAQQPKDTLVASLSREADNIATFAGRSVLVSREHAIAYHQGYYQQIRQRTLDLIRAQYSPELSELQQVTQRYGIDYWLVESGAFQPEAIEQNRWLRQFQPEAKPAIAILASGQQPALARFMPTCTVFRDGNLALVEAACLLQATDSADG